MILVSHRGNLSGPDPDKENNPTQINKTLDLGYDCEVDLWIKDDVLYLGHDEPKYEIDINFLSRPRLWIHVKNLEGLEKIPRWMNFFWHQTDDFTLTSKHFIWTFPDKKTCQKSVIVDNNKNWRDKNYNCFGVCTDWVL